MIIMHMNLLMYLATNSSLGIGELGFSAPFPSMKSCQISCKVSSLITKFCKTFLRELSAWMPSVFEICGSSLSGTFVDSLPFLGASTFLLLVPTMHTVPCLFEHSTFCTCWWSVPIKSVHKLWQFNIAVNFLHSVCLMSFDNFYYMSPCLGISYFPSSWILRKASWGGLGILEVSHNVLLTLGWEPHQC